ncbi:MAG: hypothetical protein ACD_76C00007G0004 [uncultured bacterium]|nr:MAG: hypothetical protein ACD_76C00007G0004 [uncultured bacterium]HBD05079.1 hypothetical protein [Candidatus Uhrbacteria bacterium]
MTKPKTILISAVLGLVLVLPAQTNAQTASDKFVRTANYFLMSGRALEDQSAIDTLSKFDLIVLPAEAQEYNKPFFAEARKRNPDIVILAYVPTVSWNSIWRDPLHNRLQSGIRPDMWLKKPDGSPVSVWPGTQALNLSGAWSDYLAEFASRDIVGSGVWDGIFYDEVSDSISWAGPSNTTDSAWADGYVNLLSKTRAKIGSQKIIITNGSSNSRFSQYVNGRMFETFPTPWEAGGSWEAVMQKYIDLQKTVQGQPPVFVINSNTNNTGFNSDYQKMRFGLTSALLGNGYFGFDFGDKNHGQLWYYDEFDANLGSPANQPRDLLNPANTRLNKSVWKRDFSNGAVVVNSTDAAQTVRLPGEYEKLRGTQDPSTNNGSVVSRVTLLPKDGVILLRTVQQITNAPYVNGSFVRIFNKSGQASRTGFFSFDPRFEGSDRVISIDIDRDGKLEAVSANSSRVTVLEDNGTIKAQFFPYTDKYKMGINFAVADLEGDGTFEIITGTERGGGPQIRIFNTFGVLINPGFFAYDKAFRGGVDVAVGDLNGDGTQEIIAGAGVGGGPHVRVFNKNGVLINPGFFAFDQNFRGGVNVATADIDGNGAKEIIAGMGRGGAPEIRVFNKDGKTIHSGFFAFDSRSRAGVEVAGVDIDSDGAQEIIGFSNEMFTISGFTK